MGRGYPNSSRMRFDFSSPQGMGIVTGKYIRVGYGDGESKTCPHPAPLSCLAYHRSTPSSQFQQLQKKKKKTNYHPMQSTESFSKFAIYAHIFIAISTTTTKKEDKVPSNTTDRIVLQIRYLCSPTKYQPWRWTKLAVKFHYTSSETLYPQRGNAWIISSIMSQKRYNDILLACQIITTMWLVYN